MIKQNGVWDYSNVISYMYHEARKISRSRVKFFGQLKDVISHFLKASPSLDKKHLANCLKENNQLDVLTNVFCCKSTILDIAFQLSILLSLVTNPADDMCVCMRRGGLAGQWQRLTGGDMRGKPRSALFPHREFYEKSIWTSTRWYLLFQMILKGTFQNPLSSFWKVL